MPFARKALRYAFPDQWSFLLGEVALYAFIVLVGTGIYLTLFFDPSTARTVYHGSYGPLQGQEVTDAYNSVLRISFDVKAGPADPPDPSLGGGRLRRRDRHPSGPDLLHRCLSQAAGADLCDRRGDAVPALLEGYLGYSLVDDLLSGMGLAIGYSVALSVPFIGANLGLLIWGGQLPGEPDFWSRMYIAHVYPFR